MAKNSKKPIEEPKVKPAPKKQGKKATEVQITVTDDFITGRFAEQLPAIKAK
jgi:hypothetical protein